MWKQDIDRMLFCIWKGILQTVFQMPCSDEIIHAAFRFDNGFFDIKYIL